MHPYRKRLPNILATLEAPLRSETRRHFDNPRPSFFRFECEDILECRPARVGDGLREMAVLEHVPDSEVFDSDEGVTFDVFTNRLVGVILALAGYSEVLPGGLFRCFTAAVGA